MLKQGVNSLLFRRGVVGGKVGGKSLGGLLRFSNAAALVQEEENRAAVRLFSFSIAQSAR